MITLYQFPVSHYCEKVRWALAYKQLDYKTVNLLPALHTFTTKKLSPSSSLPILVDNTKVIQNSSDIISYLDEQFLINPLTPSDNDLKQQALAWEQFADTEIGINLRVFFYHHLLPEPKLLIPVLTNNGAWYYPLVLKLIYPQFEKTMRESMHINEHTAQLAQQQLSVAIDKLYQHLQSHPFLVGDSFSRADLTAAALLAPLIKTPKYGINWGKQPIAIENFIAQHCEKLAWVEALYSQYR
jgi:glutathione S-transferase